MESDITQDKEACFSEVSPDNERHIFSFANKLLLSDHVLCCV